MDSYEWDEAKNQANRRKHGVGFDLAGEFGWSDAVYRTDDRQDYEEPRRLAYGFAGRRASAADAPQGDEEVWPPNTFLSLAQTTPPT